MKVFLFLFITFAFVVSQDSVQAVLKPVIPSNLPAKSVDSLSPLLKTEFLPKKETIPVPLKTPIQPKVSVDSSTVPRVEISSLKLSSSLEVSSSSSMIVVQRIVESPKRIVKKVNPAQLDEAELEALRQKGLRFKEIRDSLARIDSMTQVRNSLQLAERIADSLQKQSEIAKMDSLRLDSLRLDSIKNLPASVPAALSSSETKRDSLRSSSLVLSSSTQDSVLKKDVKSPDILSVMSGGVISGAEVEESKTSNSQEEALDQWKEFFSFTKISTSLFVLLLGWFGIGFTTRMLDILSERWPSYRLTLKGLQPIVRVVSWTALLTFIVVVVFHPPMQTIMAFSASAGIAIGFASQDILKNTFAGILILFDRPFRVGDKIQIHSYYGEVVGIGLRTVRIHTADDSIISIPNTEIINQSVSNSNAGEPDCQVVISFWFEEDLDMAKAKTLALQCLALSPYIYLKKFRAVLFEHVVTNNKRMIRMNVKGYVLDHRYENAFKSNVTEIIFREFRKAGLLC